MIMAGCNGSVYLSVSLYIFQSAAVRPCGRADYISTSQRERETKVYRWTWPPRAWITFTLIILVQCHVKMPHSFIFCDFRKFFVTCLWQRLGLHYIIVKLTIASSAHEEFVVVEGVLLFKYNNKLVSNDRSIRLVILPATANVDQLMQL